VWVVASGLTFLIFMGGVIDVYIEPKPNRSLWQALSPSLYFMAGPIALSTLGWLALSDRLTWRDATKHGLPWGAAAGLIAMICEFYSISPAFVVAALLVLMGIGYRSTRVVLIALAAFVIVFIQTIMVAGTYQLLNGPHRPS